MVYAASAGTAVLPYLPQKPGGLWGCPPAQGGAMGLRCFWSGDSGVLWGIKNLISDTNQK